MELGTLFDNLALGFSVAISLQNLFWCLVGAVIQQLTTATPDRRLQRTNRPMVNSVSKRPAR